MSSPASPRKSEPLVGELCGRAADAAQRARVPYSRRPEGAVVLLSDGSWVPGVRIESASFPLTIPALQAAYVSAISAGRRDVVGAALSRPASVGEWGWFAEVLDLAAEDQPEDDVMLRTGELPSELGERLSITLDQELPSDDARGIELTREVARRAYTPYSDFPVGCVVIYQLESGGTALVPGVNVEHRDWTRGLCAERSALAATLGLGRGVITGAYLSCLNHSLCSPCGACRQLLVELLPDRPLVVDRGPEPPQRFTPRALLPHGFDADFLRQ